MPLKTEPKPSRTQKKKTALYLQALGRKLAALSDTELDALDAIPQVLRAAIMELREMKSHGARRRQEQYIGKIMRQVEVDARQLEDALNNL